MTEWWKCEPGSRSPQKEPATALFYYLFVFLYMVKNIKDIIDMVPTYTDKVYAGKPDADLVDAADKFFHSLHPYYRKMVTVDSITRRDDAIIIDWAVRKDFVSVEVTKNSVGYYTEMPDGSNPEGCFPLSDECPKPIQKALDFLYCRKTI